MIAAAGILQFVAQFAGLRLFSFTGLLPERLLYETGSTWSFGSVSATC